MTAADERPRRFIVVSGFIWPVISLATGIMMLWPGVLDVNVALRGGIAAFLIGNGVASLLSAVAFSRVARREREAILLRSLAIQTWVYVATGIIVGIGALWYGGVGGFLGAYAAFSFAWMWFWLRRDIFRAKPAGDAQRPTP